MQDNETGKKVKSTAFGALGALGVLALKFKAGIFVLLKSLSLFKFGFFLKSGLTMFITLWVYTMFWGWPYAVAIVLLILVHEGGHYIWMKAAGLDPQLPMFVPGVGAYVQMTKMPADQATHAWVAFAGPLIGGIFSAALYLGGVKTSNGWMMAAGSSGFFLNLIQMIPAKPLDGGFVIRAVSEWLLIPGMALLFMTAWMFQSILLLIIGVLSFISVFKTISAKMRDEPTGPPDETPASLPQRVIIGIAYVSLTGMLGWLYYISNTASMSMMH